jgi:pimeloyl-ACP methyl ester carboxylesterase
MSKLISKDKKTIFRLLSIVLFSWISFLALSSSIENEEIRFSKRDLYDGWGELEWSPCGEFECATISVNISLSLSDEKISISLIKYSPDNKRKSRNYLIVNPGNRSGISIVKSSGRDIAKLFDNRYDIIGIDPRGIGSSNPIICSTEPPSFPYMKVFGATFLPKDATLIQAINYDSTSKLHAQICGNSSDDVIRNNGMIFIAKDLEQIRIALGTRKLNYWGIGYGALAGLEYSKEFPKNIGNMILDSPPSPTTYHEYYGGDILSHIFSVTANVESSLSLIAKQCDHSNNCPLSKRNKSSLLALESVMNNLRRNPQMIDDEKGGILTVERVEQLLYYSLARPYEWYGIAAAFDLATQGNFKLLFELYQKFKMPTTKELFLLNAPICNDSFVKQLSVEEWMEKISEMEKTNSFAARILGSHLMQW